MAATPEQVYDLVADVTRTGEWGEECVRCEWLDQPGAVGSRFRGHNRSGRAQWSRECEVLVADRGHEVAWRIVPGKAPTRRDYIRWSCTLTPVEGGTRVVLAYQLLEPPMAWFPPVSAR